MPVANLYAKDCTLRTHIVALLVPNLDLTARGTLKMILVLSSSRRVYFVI